MLVIAACLRRPAHPILVVGVIVAQLLVAAAAASASEVPNQSPTGATVARAGNTIAGVPLGFAIWLAGGLMLLAAGLVQVRRSALIPVSAADSPAIGQLSPAVLSPGATASAAQPARPVGDDGFASPSDFGVMTAPSGRSN